MFRNLATFALALVCVSCASNVPNSATNSLPPPPAADPPAPQTAFTISPDTLPPAAVSVGYRTGLTASGGTSPYVWTVASGNLPDGLILDEAQGVVTGIPSTAGTASITIQAQDSAGQSATKNIAVTVRAGDWASTYYVDSAAGKDTNSGTSETGPWQTIAKVNSAEFSPGDRILFKKGGVWREQLQLASSGVAGNPILLGAYGSGAAPVISGSDLIASSTWAACSTCPANVWKAPVKAQPNVVAFNGSTGRSRTALSQLSTAKDWFWSAGVLYVFSSGNPGTSYQKPGVEAGTRQLAAGFFGISFVTVQDIQFSGANGLPTNGAVYAQASSSSGQSSHDLSFLRVTVVNGASDGIHLEDCNNCIVENSTISGMARAGLMLVNNQPEYPVTAGATLGNTIFNNHFDAISTWGCAIGETCKDTALPQGQFFSGLIISRNTVHDNGAGIYIRWTNKSSVTSNTSYNNHDTTLKGEGYGVGVEASSNNFIQKNLLYGNRTRGIELSNDEGAGTKLTGSTNNVIQYNAIHDNGDHGLFTNGAPTHANRFLYNIVWNHPNGECFLANGTDHVFYGNTCWNNSTGVDLYTSTSTPTTSNITIKNNIFAKNITRAVHIESGVSTSSIKFDSNSYDAATATPFLSGSQAGDLKAWQALGFDLHSLVGPIQFVNSAPSAPGDFVVQPGSPALTAGADLGLSFASGLNQGSSWPSSVKTSKQGKEWAMGAFLQNP